MDNILYVNTASIEVLIASGSLFGSASYATSASSAISASYAPNVFATSASFATTSSYSVTSSYSISSSHAASANTANTATTSSFATTASYFNVFPQIKSGKITASLFGGSPMTSSVTFTIPYSNNEYSVTIVGGDARSWTLEFVSASNFTISSNSNQALTDYVYWTSIGNGEST